MSGYGKCRDFAAAAAFAAAVASASAPAFAWEVTTAANGAAVLSSLSQAGDHKLEFVCQPQTETSDRYYVQFSGVDWRPRLFISSMERPYKVLMQLRRDREKPMGFPASLLEGAGRAALTAEELSDRLADMVRTQEGYVVHMDAEHGTAAALFPSQGLAEAATTMRARCGKL